MYKNNLGDFFIFIILSAIVPVDSARDSAGGSVYENSYLTYLKEATGNDLVFNTLPQSIEFSSDCYNAPSSVCLKKIQDSLLYFNKKYEIIILSCFYEIIKSH